MTSESPFVQCNAGGRRGRQEAREHWQIWTLTRIKTLIERRCHQSYTIQGVTALLKRHGRTCQVPARQAVGRDEETVAGWAKETWPHME
uniref:helix-turn-helix domain-containing protein n=1 Tax=Streptomyces albicerus TaxID=2569859 RepID=UPI00384CF7C0